jgi:hypothetical protein
MPIQFLQAQQRMRLLGEIRMGTKVATSNGRKRPERLANWRLTSPDPGLLAQAAQVLGGEVQLWTDAPANSNSKYELFTDTPELACALPPGDQTFSQWMEQWNAGGCLRRCDGVTDTITGTSCACPLDDPDAMKAGRAPKAQYPTCAPTTRVSLFLTDIPDLGVWKLETHGMNAARELAPAVHALAMASANGRPQPAVLRLEERHTQLNGLRKDFAVPVISLPTMSIGQALGLDQPRQTELSEPDNYETLELAPGPVVDEIIDYPEPVAIGPGEWDPDKLLAAIEQGDETQKRALTRAQREYRKSVTPDALRTDRAWASVVASIYQTDPI